MEAISCDARAHLTAIRGDLGHLITSVLNARAGGGRDAAPRPAERAGQRAREAARDDLQRVRCVGPKPPVRDTSCCGHPLTAVPCLPTMCSRAERVGRGLRRRQVPPRHLDRLHRKERRKRAASAARKHGLHSNHYRPGHLGVWINRPSTDRRHRLSPGITGPIHLGVWLNGPNTDCRMTGPIHLGVWLNGPNTDCRMTGPNHLGVAV